jgi:hypothetical protein
MEMMMMMIIIIELIFILGANSISQGPIKK